MNNEDKSILIVDDDPNNIKILQLDLEDEGYTTMVAHDGMEAWDILQKNKDKISIILLDRMMPNMDGMEFMAKLKSDETIAHKLVIMQTAAAEKSQVAEGIRAGVYYYLTKPYDVEVMLSLVRAAVDDYANYHGLLSELNQFKEKVHLVKESHFEIRTLEDVRYLSTFLASFYPNSEQVILGISELLINAVEHGNLGITYEEKSILQKENRWDEEIEARLNDPDYAQKMVNIHFQRLPDSILLTIKDDGDGFDWRDYIEIDPDRVTHSHGRGIALSNMMSFDSMEYKGKGNEVVCKVLLK